MRRLEPGRVLSRARVVADESGISMFEGGLLGFVVSEPTHIFDVGHLHVLECCLNTCRIILT